MAWGRCDKSLWFSILMSLFGSLFPVSVDAHGAETHLVRTIGDQSADRSDFGTTQLSVAAKEQQKAIEFFLSEIGMLCSESPNFLDDFFRPAPLSAFFGCLRLLIQGLDLSPTFPEPGLP